MNKNDSERLERVLIHAGLESSTTPEHSDLILINTCSIRQTAENRVFGNMHNFARLKETNPKLILGITGCMPGRDTQHAIRAKLPMVDLFFPINDMVRLPTWISELRPEYVNTEKLDDDYLKIHPHATNPYQAFVTISTGCNNFCTFCVVPFSRGRERSRPVQDLLDEVRHCVARGVKEITLLGQNVNTYRPEDPQSFSTLNPYKDPFAALLWEINQIPKISRIHFTAPNPQDMTDEVIHALSLPHHINFLHLPIQAGSERILKKMNRRHTKEQYLAIIDKVRNVRPTIAIGTDIIVGFCGETEEDFMETVDLYKKVQFDISYTAKYSTRSGTAAHIAFKDDVPYAEKKRRWNYLQDVMEEITLKKNIAYIGSDVEVLVDSYQRGICEGNSREYKRVRFPCSRDLTGEEVNVTIQEAFTWILKGSLHEKSTPNP